MKDHEKELEISAIRQAYWKAIDKGVVADEIAGALGLSVPDQGDLIAKGSPGFGFNANNVVLGSVYQDSLTGFKGVATAICHYLSSPERQVYLESKDSSQARWFEESRLSARLGFRKRLGDQPTQASVDNIG